MTTNGSGETVHDGTVRVGELDSPVHAIPARRLSTTPMEIRLFIDSSRVLIARSVAGSGFS
jgi:hypothetical protein